MNYYLFYLLALIGVLVQRIFIPINWVLLVVLIGALKGPDRKAAWLAFWAGIGADIFALQPVGKSSLVFLGLTYTITRLLKNQPLNGNLVVFFLGWGADLLYRFILFQTVSVREGLIFGICFGVALIVLFPRNIETSKELKLKLER